MANPKKCEVKVKLAVGTRILVYDANAIAELEDFFGKPVQQFMREIATGFGVSKLRVLLFYGLQSHHEDEFSTIKEAGAAMELGAKTADTLKEYGTGIFRALSLALTGKEPSERNGAPGSASGRARYGASRNRPRAPEPRVDEHQPGGGVLFRQSV